MPSSTESKIGMAKTILSTIGSVAAAAMVVRSVARDYLPPEYQDYLYFGFRSFIYKFSTQLTMVIHEVDGFAGNEIYKATELYLATRIYNGVKFRWSLVATPTRDCYRNDGVAGSSVSDLRMLELKFHRKHKDLALKDIEVNEIGNKFTSQQETKQAKNLAVDPIRY